MIETRYSTKQVLEGTRFSITIKGHADYSERGTDIVCAGVSALVMALVGKLESLEEESKVMNDITAQNGEVVITTIAPIYTDMLLCECAYDTILRGLSAIHTKYPNNVAKIQFVEKIHK